MGYVYVFYQSGQSVPQRPSSAETSRIRRFIAVVLGSSNHIGLWPVQLRDER